MHDVGIPLTRFTSPFLFHPLLHHSDYAENPTVPTCTIQKILSGSPFNLGHSPSVLCKRVGTSSDVKFGSRAFRKDAHKIDVMVTVTMTTKKAFIVDDLKQTCERYFISHCTKFIMPKAKRMKIGRLLDQGDAIRFR